jgi:hypothetical protein
MKNLNVLFFMVLGLVCFGQTEEVVELVPGTDIRILVSGDTTMMSNRQFFGLRDFLRTYKDEVDMCRNQVEMLLEVERVNVDIQRKYEKVSDMQKMQLDNCMREYNTMIELAHNHRELINDMRDDIFRANKKAVWRGIGYGVGGGIVVGIITGILIMK